MPASAVPRRVAANRGADVDPKLHAAEPPSPEAVIQRARERAAAKLPRSSPRHWTEQRRLFATELLAADGVNDRRACGQFIGWRYKWYGPDLVDKAVDECAAKLLYGAAAIEFLKRYPFEMPDAEAA